MLVLINISNLKYTATNIDLIEFIRARNTFRLSGKTSAPVGGVLFYRILL
jgi:hypothetical protein